MQKPSRKQIHLAGKLYGLAILVNMDMGAGTTHDDDEEPSTVATQVRSAMVADARRSLTLRRVSGIRSEEDALRIAMTLTT